MEHLKDHIQAILENDSKIRELVALVKDNFTKEMYPAIAQEEAPQFFKMPYIVIRVESDVPEGEESGLNDRAIFSFDVVGENNLTKVERIARRIEQLFDRRKLMPYGISAHREGVYPIISDDPSLQGRNVKILVRYPREDLLEEDETWHTNTVVAYVQARPRT